MRFFRILGGLALGLGLALAAAAPRAEELAGKVTEVEGAVQALHPDGRAEPLALNAPVYLGDRISTATKSRVCILLNDDSLITLGPNTKLEINALVYKPRQSRSSIFSLVQGSLMAVVGGWFSAEAGEAQWEVRTPTAVAGVRGSSLVVDVPDEGQKPSTTVAGLGGLIGVQALVDPSGKIVLLQPNFFTVVPEGGPPGDAQILDAAMLQDLLSDFNFTLSSLDQRGDDFRNSQGVQATTVYLTPQALASLLGLGLSDQMNFGDPSQLIFQEPPALTPVRIRVIMP